MVSSPIRRPLLSPSPALALPGWQVDHQVYRQHQARLERAASRTRELRSFVISRAHLRHSSAIARYSAAVFIEALSSGSTFIPNAETIAEGRENDAKANC